MRRTAIALLSTTLLTGCVVWKKDYDAVVAQNQQLASQLAAERAQVSRLAGAIRYTVNSDLLFAPGSWEMNPRGAQIISSFAQRLASTQQNRILVSGFTDNAPIGARLRREGVDSNEELSQRRANAVMEYLISQGVRQDMVVAKGFGESNPVAPNDTPQGRAQNRRVELSLLPNGAG